MHIFVLEGNLVHTIVFYLATFMFVLEQNLHTLDLLLLIIHVSVSKKCLESVNLFWPATSVFVLETNLTCNRFVLT